MISKGQYNKATNLSMELIDLCQDGLNYYQTYDWIFLKTIVSLGYLGWILYSTLFILKTYVYVSLKIESNPSIILNSIGLCAVIGTAILLLLKKAPITYYLYASFPIFFWIQSLKEKEFVSLIICKKIKRPGSALSHCILYLIGLELLVFIFFISRSVLISIERYCLPGYRFLACSGLSPCQRLSV